MLDAKEIDIEIARLEYGESSYLAYQKLADLYIIRNQMERKKVPEMDYSHAYAAAPAPLDTPIIGEYGDSDFLRETAGKDPASVFAIVDDLMDTLHTVNRKVYDSVMRKIQNI